MYGMVALADILIFLVGVYGMYSVLTYGVPKVQPAFAPAFRVSIFEIKTPIGIVSIARRKEWYQT